MADDSQNKLAAQILRAEMLGDQEKVTRLKAQLSHAKSNDETHNQKPVSKQNREAPSYSRSRPVSNYESLVHKREHVAQSSNSKVDKFIKSTSSLSNMFVEEKKLTASDEVKMFLKTSLKFARDDMETKHFSEEIDDSQKILNRQTKRQKMYGPTREYLEAIEHKPDAIDHQETCHGCPERVAKHLLIDRQSEHVYMCLLGSKPILSSLSNVIIRNKDHSCGSFVSASNEHQEETELTIDILRSAWKTKGYRCLVMETYYRNRRLSSREYVSCGNHFQIHCLPIKEKHYERSRMCFKQALQACENEWSMNKQLIKTDGRRIQRYLPKELSYFWVCFDNLQNGIGYVIENDQEFSRNFGFEVLSGLLNKNFNPAMLNQREKFDDQFERCRDFKVLYTKFKDINKDK